MLALNHKVVDHKMFWFHSPILPKVNIALNSIHPVMDTIYKKRGDFFSSRMILHESLCQIWLVTISIPRVLVILSLYLDGGLGSKILLSALFLYVSTYVVSTLGDTGFFRLQGIKVLWRLQFLGYFRTLSLKSQKARTKIEVVLTLPS